METARADSYLPLGIRILLRLLTLAAAGLALWFVVAVTTAGVFRERAPAWALRFVPFDARAQATLAERMLAPGRNRAGPRRVRALAAAALQRDPTAVDGATALGISFALTGDAVRAERAFAYASRLSRRDVPTQLWLIERSVQRNDIAGALSHYDPVLRTSPAMHTILFPILTNASAEPLVANELNRMLRGRPNWRPDFLSALLTGQYDPAALYTVTRGLLTPADTREREQLGLLFKRLTERQAFDLAWRAYLAALPERRSGGPGLWNGDFAQEPAIGPFDWSFPEDPALAPERRPLGPAGGFALYLPAGVTSDVEVARQLVRLEPGRYAVSARVGNVSGDEAVRPRLVVRCAQEPQPELTRADFPTATEGGRSFTATVEIPAACRYQWISVWVRGSFDQQLSETPWISSIRIREL